MAYNKSCGKGFAFDISVQQYCNQESDHCNQHNDNRRHQEGMLQRLDKIFILEQPDKIVKSDKSGALRRYKAVIIKAEPHGFYRRV